MYPYSLIEITNLKGETVTLKPQNFNFSISKELRLRLKSCISTAPKTAIYPENYLNSTNILNFEDFTCGIVDNNLSDIPIVDDYTASEPEIERTGRINRILFFLLSVRISCFADKRNNRAAVYHDPMHISQHNIMLSNCYQA